MIPGLGRFPWRRAWPPTPVFLPGEFHGQRSLVGCSPWGHKELDTDEKLTHTHTEQVRKCEGQEWTAGGRDDRRSETQWKRGRKSRQSRASPSRGYWPEVRRAVYQRCSLPSQVSTVPFYSTFSGARLLESTCNAGDLGLIPELERSSGEGKGYLLQYSGLDNSMDCIVHEVAKGGTQLSDFHFHFSYKTINDGNKALEFSTHLCTKTGFCFIWSSPLSTESLKAVFLRFGLQ